MPGTLSLRALNRATLARQMLLARERVDALTAVERLLALQAQWPRPPFLSLWSRLEGFEREHLGDLARRRRVVRATFNRATIHVVTANDYVALRPAIAPALDVILRGLLRERIAAVDLDALLATARTLLSEQPRTFADLRNAFTRASPSADERAMGYAVRLLLPLVQVPDADAGPWLYPAQSAFALADEWLARALPKEAAPPDTLVCRYLAAYGPSTLADVQAWLGMKGLGAVIERLRPSLVVLRDERRRELFDLPDAPRPEPDVAAPVRLLPDFDSMIVARGDERFVSKAHRSRVFLPGLRIAPTVLVDGVVAGTWTIERRARAATLVLQPFGALRASARHEVMSEAEALVRFAEPDARNADVRIAS